MKSVHVELVSAQPIPNLTTVIQFKPDTVVLLYTDDMKKQKERLEQAIKARSVRVESRQIEPYGMENVLKVCESIIKEFSGCDLSLNITGGTKIGTLGSFQAFYYADLPIFYVNPKENVIIQVAPQEKTIPVQVKIPIKEYLAVYGFNVTGFIADDSDIQKRREVTRHIMDAALINEKLVGLLNAAVPDSKGMQFPKEITIPNVPEIQQAVQKLEELGMLSVKGTSIVVQSEAIVNYLRGFWFEELVYTTARAIGADEVKLNVTGTWDAAVKNPPTNEFDVMIAKGTCLACISCKTSDPNRSNTRDDEGIGKGFLYELDSLSDSALGLFGKRMIASVRQISSNYVRDRARVMKIDLIDGNNIRTLKESLQAWLNA